MQDVDWRSCGMWLKGQSQSIERVRLSQKHTHQGDSGKRAGYDSVAKEKIELKLLQQWTAVLALLGPKNLTSSQVQCMLTD